MFWYTVFAFLKDPLAQLALVDVTIPEETVTELVNSSAQTINNTSRYTFYLQLVNSNAQTIYNTSRYTSYLPPPLGQLKRSDHQ